MWYVYFLLLANGDKYIGSTNDLGRRFSRHAKGLVVSTRKNLPVKLISYIGVLDEQTARRLERYFKSGSGKAFANKRFWGELGAAPGPPINPVWPKGGRSADK